MPLDHACMTAQKFSCGFKSHVIGEYTIGLSKSNQSLHGLSTCTNFCSECAQIKSWGKPPIKGKYLVTLRKLNVILFFLIYNPRQLKLLQELKCNMCIIKHNRPMHAKRSNTILCELLC